MENLKIVSEDDKIIEDLNTLWKWASYGRKKPLTGIAGICKDAVLLIERQREEIKNLRDQLNSMHSKK